MTFAQRDGQTIHHEGIIESYYLCGETEKANELLGDYQRVLNDRLTYFNSLKPRFRQWVDQEVYETRSQLEELRILLAQYGQEDMMPESGM